MMRNQQIYRHHMIYIKDQNLKSLHKDLRHSNVKKYELARKRHVQTIHRNFTKNYSVQF